VVDGVVVFDGGTKAPEGARVEVSFAIEGEVFEYPHPLAPYDRQKEVALMRERIARHEAGDPGIPIEQFLAECQRG